MKHNTQQNTSSRLLSDTPMHDKQCNSLGEHYHTRSGEVFTKEPSLINSEPEGKLLTDEELEDKLDEKLETLMGFLGERDSNDSWWGFDTEVGTLEDEIGDAVTSLIELINTQKRLYAETAIKQLSLSPSQRKARENYDVALTLHTKGYGYGTIGRIMGVTKSTAQYYVSRAKSED